MNYITVACFACISVFSILGYSIEGEAPQEGSSSVDECVPIVTEEDVQILNALSLNSMQYLTGKIRLSPKQVVAFQHLSEEDNKCRAALMLMITQPETLLQIMETLADQNSPKTLTQVKAIRHIELDLSGLTRRDVAVLMSLSSEQLGSSNSRSSVLDIPKNLSEEDWDVLQKYITIAKKVDGLTGFMNGERAKILQTVVENLENGFSVEDLDILRTAELRALGVPQKDISLLNILADKKASDSRLTLEEISALKNWILIESLPVSRNLMPFGGIANIHQRIQEQPAPPFSPKELFTDVKFFQLQLAQAPLMDVRIVDGLKSLAEDISTYLGENKRLTSFQESICRRFITSMLQFGRIPNLDSIQVGELLQLIELRLEFSNMIYNLKKVRNIELVKSGITYRQESLFNQLAETSFSEERKPLSKEELVLLNQYIGQAKKIGELNGFGIQQRAAFFSIIQHQIRSGNSGFKPADLEILRQVEFRNNGFSNEEIYQFSQIAKEGKQAEELQPEELLLLKKFVQVDELVSRLVGPGFLIDSKEGFVLKGIIKQKSQSREVKPNSPNLSQRPKSPTQRPNIPSVPNNKPSRSRQ